MRAYDTHTMEMATRPFGHRSPFAACTQIGRWQRQALLLHSVAYHTLKRTAASHRIVRTEVTLSRGQDADVHGDDPDTSAREGLAMSVMSNSDIEGDPLQFLKVSEAYWQASLSDNRCMSDFVISSVLHTLQRSEKRQGCNHLHFAGHEVSSSQERPCSDPCAA